MVGERLLERSGDVLRHAGQGGVEHGGVLALEQADRSDLMTQRDGDLAAEQLVGELARGQFMLGRDG